MLHLAGIAAKKHKKSFFNQIKMNRWMYIMLASGVIYYIVFRYLPMWGLIMGFMDYMPHKGLLGSRWVGFKHFMRFFNEPAFNMLFRNTLTIGILNLVIYFPIPIILALMLNEVRCLKLKKFVQTCTYIPHFVSWVVIVSISNVIFSYESGVLNLLLNQIGMGKINFMLKPEWFYPLFFGQIILKEAGWGTIIFLAALAGVDVSLYEASKIDGANRWKQIWYITLPAIKSTIITLLILRLGRFLNTGFEHIFLMLNAMNRHVAEVFDTYVYENGIQRGLLSYSIAVGFFKSAISLILVVSSNYLAKKVGHEGIY